MSEATAELSTFFEAPQLDQEAFRKYADLVFQSARTYERFGTLLAEHAEKPDASALHLGVGYLLLGRFQQALEWLTKAPADKFRHYYAAQAACGHQQYEQAIDFYTQARKAGWDPFEIDMRIAEINLKLGKHDAVRKTIAAHEKDGTDRADWYYLRGLLTEDQGDRRGALELYEKALTLDAEHVPTMFRAAWLYDLQGDDERAIELYQRLATQPRAHVNALINLAVIYEDIGRYDEALSCLRRVLAAYPNHTRAQLFYKDVANSREMIIDDTLEKRAESRNRLLATPINEFELSVRARNCLHKMKIQTLGDLLRFTEAELLSYKNFGETSLEEIKQLLAKRGLRLGQKPEEIDVTALGPIAGPAAPAPPVNVPPGREALLSRPVSELELSVRSRRCLQRLNVQTLGDLIQKTEAELLATRNFGQTSLEEIKSRLAELGLSLAPKT